MTLPVPPSEYAAPFDKATLPLKLLFEVLAPDTIPVPPFRISVLPMIEFPVTPLATLAVSWMPWET